MEIFKKLIIIFCIAIPSVAFSQNDNWQDGYKLLTYDKALKACKATLPDDSVDCAKSCYNYVGLFDLKFKVQFEYEDEISEIEGNRADYVKRWTKTYWPSGEYDGMFMHQILVSIKGETQWIFVQEKTLKYYSEELDKGDKLYLYLMFVGTLIVNNEAEYIFVANDFEKK